MMKSILLAILIVLIGLADCSSYAYGSDVRRLEKLFRASPLLRRMSADYDWSYGREPIKANESKSILSLNQQQVFSLVDELLEPDSIRKETSWVEEHSIRDLDKDGILEIVAVISENCTSCPNQLVIIKKKRDRFVLFHFDSAHVSINQVVDLNKDGIDEVKLHDWVPGKASMAEAVYWPYVLAWRNGQYVDESEEYPEVYKDYVKRMQDRIQEMEIQLTHVKDKATTANKETLDDIQHMEDVIQEYKKTVASANAFIAARKSVKP